MKLSKNKYKELRKSALVLAGELGTMAELTEELDACLAYDKACEMLDAIDSIGLRLKYITSDDTGY